MGSEQDMILKVNNRISECRAANRKILNIDKVRYLIWHRILLNDILLSCGDTDAVSIARAFTNKDLGTDGKCPYHIVVLEDGTMEQMLPLTIRGAHARALNGCSWGVAAVGDFRKEPPKPIQMRSIRWLTRALYPINGGLDIGGHTEFDDTTKYKGHDCPGSYFDVATLKDYVKSPVVALDAGIVV